MQHFIVNADLSASQITLDKDIAHQMKNVLRFKSGDEIMVLDGQGSKAKGTVTELHRKGAVIELSDFQTTERPSQILRLYIGISKKPGTLELIIQKATELGVTDIIPVAMDRCQVKHLRKQDRLEMIIREASEQCERLFLPRLHDVKSLEDIESGLTLVGDARDTDIKLVEADLKSNEINLVIGPEGGLTADELTLLRENGAKVFLLGDNVLRMETAAIAALSIVQFG